MTQTETCCFCEMPATVWLLGSRFCSEHGLEILNAPEATPKEMREKLLAAARGEAPPVRPKVWKCPT